ncbi:MAG: S41 family peptidase [Armatimonadota bacterium]
MKKSIKIARIGFVLSSSVFACAMIPLAQNQDGTDKTSAVAQRLVAAKKAMRGQRANLSLEQLEQLSLDDPSNGDVVYRKALMLGAAKKYPEAIVAYNRALELGAASPKFVANVNYDLACCYAQTGDLSTAIKTLERAIDLGFRDIRHVQVDTDLLPLHTNPKWENLVASKDTSKMSRTEGFQYDLWFLNRELRRIHYRFDNRYPASAFDAQVSKVSAGIPNWPDEKILMEMRRLMVMANDGHTNLWALMDGNRPPFDMEMFEDGVHVLGAKPGFERLLGQSVIAVNDIPIKDFLDQFGQWVSKDNEMGTINAISFFGTNTSFLFGAGIIPSKDLLTATFRAADGKTTRETFACNKTNQATVSPIKDSAKILWLKKSRVPYWAEMIPNTKTLFFQYNTITSEQAEPIDKFADNLMKLADDNHAERLIIDLRHNGGGNNQSYRHLLRTLVRSKFNESGRLFVIAGRRTFSAAQCFATDVERQTDAIFVGEPTGSSPNFIGEAVPITLPYSKAMGVISDLYWQRGQSFDFRKWISPEIHALNTYDEYASGRDVAVEAILKYPLPERKN